MSKLESEIHGMNLTTVEVAARSGETGIYYIFQKVTGGAVAACCDLPKTDNHITRKYCL
jgi:hypothetical protein